MKEKIYFKTKTFSVIERSENKSDRWYYIKKKNGVAILAIDDKKNVILVKQDRPAVKTRLLELPAGSINNLSKIELEAKRELLEETGYYADKLQKLTEIYPSPGYYSEKTYIFLATKLKYKSSNKTFKEVKNNLKVEKISVNKIMKMLENGEIKDAKTQCALLFYKKRIQLK